MKLIRLYQEFKNTIDGNTALFDNNFQSDLVVPANGKIALQNVAIDSINPSFIIDDDNYDFAWGVRPSLDPTTENIIQLPVGGINQDNVNDFAVTWTEKMNESSNFDQQSEAFTFGPYYYGLQWNITLSRLWNIEARWGQFTYATDDSLAIGTASGISSPSVQFIESGGTPGVPIAIDVRLNSGQTTDWSNAFYGLSDVPMAKGCASVRGQILTCENSGGSTDPAENGFIIGLTNKEINDDDNPETLLNQGAAALNFGIRASDSGNGVEYYAILFGQEYGPATAIIPNYDGSDPTGNDLLELVINGGEMCYNIYQYDSTAGEVLPRNLLQDPGINRSNPSQFDRTVTRTPLVIFNSESSVRNLCFTPDPFVYDSQGQDEIVMGPQVGGDEPPTQNLVARDTALKFDSASLANYLGFEAAYVGPVPSSNPIDVTITSDNPFNPLYYNDAFMVEMKNIYLESYDGYKEQRKNILMFMSIEDSTGQMNWRANEPIFIDINNKEPMLLRNIKAEMLYADYSRLRIQSDAYMTLIIKGPNE